MGSNKAQENRRCDSFDTAAVELWRTQGRDFVPRRTLRGYPGPDHVKSACTDIAGPRVMRPQSERCEFRKPDNGKEQFARRTSGLLRMKGVRTINAAIWIVAPRSPWEERGEMDARRRASGVHRPGVCPDQPLNRYRHSARSRRRRDPRRACNADWSRYRRSALDREQRNRPISP